MKLPSLLRNREQKHPWQWPSCNQQPKTLSFRAGHDDMINTVTSVLSDRISDDTDAQDQSSWFTKSSERISFSTQYKDSEEDEEEESPEVILRGVQSKRLFFQPEKTRSILDEEKAGWFSRQRVVVVAAAMESEEPYVDFRRSMEEIVEAYGLRDWECLEELLGWYLKVNGKMNHGFIVRAFVDLLVGILGSDSASFSSSAVSSFSSLSLISID